MVIKKSKPKSTSKKTSRSKTTTKPSKFKSAGQIEQYFQEQKAKVLGGLDRIKKRELRAEIALAHDN